MIGQEINTWSTEQEDQRKKIALVPALKQMLGSTTSDPHLSDRIVNRLADQMLIHGVNPYDENAVKHMLLVFANNAEPLGLGRVHPVLRAYAYAQTLRHGERR